jgi:hypothetical protein
MIHLEVTVENTAELLATPAYGAGALLCPEWCATQTGTFAALTPIPLVSGTSLYDVWHSAGILGTWYRTRISDAGGTTFSAYSAAALGGVLATYASLDDVLATFETEPVLPRKIARMASLLVTATAQAIEACGHRDYFQHPATGTMTWVVDGDGSDTLHIHEGLVSLSLLELSYDRGLTYVQVPVTDYVLRGDSPDVAEPVPDGEPFFHVRFTGFGSYVTFVPTIRAARLTGVRGWPAVPADLVEGTAQRVRQLAFASAGYSGGDAGGPDEYGRISPTDRFWPQSLYNFLQAERERFMACWM